MIRSHSRPVLRGCMLALASAMVSAAASDAQIAPSARALGMGGAYVATARGHDAIFVNPANLALPGTPYWSISSPRVLFSAGMAGPSLGEAVDILQGADRDPERRAELLALVPADGMELSADVRAPLFAMQIRRFAFAVSWGAVVDHALGHDLADLYLNGYQPGRTDYRAGNTVGRRASFYDLSLGHGRRVGPVAVGITGRYVLGRYISRSRLFDPVYAAGGDGIELEYREVFARGGNGWGLDVGAAYQPTPALTLSASVADVVGGMRWSDQLRTRALIVTEQDFGASEMHWEGLFSSFSRHSEAVDPQGAPHSVNETADGIFRDAHFPTTFRAGAAYALAASRTRLEASYQARGDGRLGPQWGRMLAAGVQQRVPLVTLRAGLATDLGDGSLIGGGLTLGALDIGVARLSDTRPGGAARQAWLGSIGLSVGTSTRMP
jgi:hypothetical protein